MFVVRGRRSDGHQLARELMSVAGLFVIGLGLRFWLLHFHTHLVLRDARMAPVVLRPLCVGHAPGGAQQLAGAPRLHAALAVESRSCRGSAGSSRWARCGRPPTSASPDHRSSTTRPAAASHCEVLYGLFAFFVLLPAVFGPQQRGAIRWALRFKPVAALGIVSYGIYLWHQAWVDMYIRWTGELFRIPLPKLFGVALGLAVASATASYVLVERPILELKDRLGWWRGRTRPAATRPAAVSSDPVPGSPSRFPRPWSAFTAFAG